MHLAEVLALTRRSYSTIWRWLKAGTFPKPIHDWPGNSLVWRRADVTAFIDKRN
jgi:predicted DNA-binding transcriptional regulator AlpA